jgi:hypothetical protein
MVDEALRGSLARDRADSADLLEYRRDLVLDILHERADGGQSEVPCPWRVPAVSLQMLQEVTDHGSVEILEGELGRRLPESTADVSAQNLKA